MSLSRISDRESASLLVDIERDHLEKIAHCIDVLDISTDFDHTHFLDRFARIGEFGIGPAKQVTPPGIKGLELAYTATRILVGDKDHEMLPVIDSGEVTSVPRPIIIYDEPMSVTDNDIDLRPDTIKKIESHYAVSLKRAFRFGVYSLATASPRIEYVNTNVGHEVSVVARSVETGHSLVGQAIQRGATGDFEAGLFGSVATRSMAAYAVFDSARTAQLVNTTS